MLRQIHKVSVMCYLHVYTLTVFVHTEISRYSNQVFLGLSFMHHQHYHFNIRNNKLDLNSLNSGLPSYTCTCRYLSFLGVGV